MEWKRDIGKRKLTLSYVVDTWGSPENYDHLVANIIRMAGVFMLQAVSRGTIGLIVALIGLILVGINQFDYFKLDRRGLEFHFW